MIAFIPARCGSKGIPMKNIKEFNGKPLIYWNLEELQNSDKIKKIVVATDCDEIKNVVCNFNFDKVEVYERDGENAQDISSTEDVLLEYVSKMDLSEYEDMMLVQITSPLTLKEHFEGGIELYKKGNYGSLLSATNSKRFYWNKQNKPLNYNPYFRPRRQDFDGLYEENGAFYIFNLELFKQWKNRLFKNIGIYEMPEYTGVEIDNEHEIVILEELMKIYQSERIKKN